MGEDANSAVDPKEESTEVYDMQDIIARRIDELKEEKLSNRTPAVVNTDGSKLKRLFEKIRLKFRRHQAKVDKRLERLAKKEEKERRDNDFNQWFFK